MKGALPFLSVPEYIMAGILVVTRSDACSARASRFLTFRARVFHGSTCAPSALTTCHWPIQKANVAIFFLTASMEVLLKGDATNRLTSFGRALSSNFSS